MDVSHSGSVGTGFSLFCCGNSSKSARSFSQIVQQLLEILRRFAGKLKILSALRMDETEYPRMQGLPLKLGYHPFQAGILQVVEAAAVRVELVTQQRHACFGEVNPDLMGAAGFQAQLHQACRAEALKHPPVGDRLLAVPCRAGQAQPLCGVAADDAADFAGLFGG